MHSITLFIIIVIAFALSFVKHISLAMYPLSAILFYYYLPVLYASSRINILRHLEKPEALHIRFYPMEITLWFVSSCFFAFILAHLISDLMFDYRLPLYHLSYFLIACALTGIIYCEWEAKRLHILNKKKTFEIQGRFLSFEILFILILLFVMNH